MLARVRLSRHGKVRVKVPGRRREVFVIPFLDGYRKRAFRNLRLILERLRINIVGEEKISRVVKLNIERDGMIRDCKLQVEDRVLHAVLNPPPEIQKRYPSLKGEYHIIFRYDGNGFFNLFVPNGHSEVEEREVEQFIKSVIEPHYSMAFLKDAALRKRQELKENRNLETFKPSLNVNETMGKTEKHEETFRAQSGRSRKIKVQEEIHEGETAEKKDAGKLEEMMTIEEMKNKIKNFHPESFREKVAYERYLKALSAVPEKEEEIHKLFYKQVVIRKDFKGFYRHLYSSAPRLLEKGIMITYN